MTRGRGITIHHRNCRHIRNADPERLVKLSWAPTDEDVYFARLRVTSVDKTGILADLSAVIAQKEANIAQANVKTTADKKGIALFTIEVKNHRQLQDIMGTLKKVKNVLTVERL
jgi:guanosine-3',5'-bis(diphosphate) 3'-pyrophosphohydrolase